MVRLSVSKIARAITLNQVQRVPGVQFAKRVLRRRRGGNTYTALRENELVDMCCSVYESLRPHLGDVTGQSAIEIGPGHNVALAYAFLRAGCRKVTAVERFSDIALDERGLGVLRGVDAKVGKGAPPLGDVVRKEGRRLSLEPKRLEIRRALFEELPLGEPVDFIYSNDVMEHIDDPLHVFRIAHRHLRPGGIFINNIDLTGHNAFSSRTRPLDFLTCDDWLWNLMFSNIVTTNRVRYGQFVEAASNAGFETEVHILSRAEPAYLADVRRSLLPRFSELSDDDLGTLECTLIARKASSS